MSALSIPVVSTCIYLYLCIFSALQAFVFWFSFSFVHAWSNNFLITLHFVSFHCAFVYQGCVISYCSHCSFHVQPFIPLSLACPFTCYCLGLRLPSFLKLFWTAAKLCSHLECQYMHRTESASNGQSEARELPRNSNQLEPTVFDNKLCQ